MRLPVCYGLAGVASVEIGRLSCTFSANPRSVIWMLVMLGESGSARLKLFRKKSGRVYCAALPRRFHVGVRDTW